MLYQCGLCVNALITNTLSGAFMLMCLVEICRLT